MGTDLEYILHAHLRKLRRRGSRTIDGSRRVRCRLVDTVASPDRAQRFQRHPVRPVPITLRLFLGRGGVDELVREQAAPVGPNRLGLTDLGYLR